MFGLSIAEIIVIFIIAILVLKPEDLPLILKQLIRIKHFISKFVADFNQIVNNFIADTKLDDFQQKSNIMVEKFENNTKEINLYLKKIIKLGSVYNGEYELDEIRKFYETLLYKVKNKSKPNRKISTKSLD